MSLRIYDSPGGDAFSIDSEFTNPFRLTFDGRVGQVEQRRLFVRNDDSKKKYTGITLSVADTEGTNITDGTNGYGIKLRVGDEQPLDQEWDTIDVANSITIPDLENINTYEPFWIRIEIPAGAEVESFEDVKIRATVAAEIWV